MLQNEKVEQGRDDRKRKYQNRRSVRLLQADTSNHQQLKHHRSYDHPNDEKNVVYDPPLH